MTIIQLFEKLNCFDHFSGNYAVFVKCVPLYKNFANNFCAQQNPQSIETDDGNIFQKYVKRFSMFYVVVIIRGRMLYSAFRMGSLTVI